MATYVFCSTMLMPAGLIRTAGSGDNSVTLRPTMNPAGSRSERGMNCSSAVRTFGRFAVVALAATLSLTCHESLPTYVFPSNIMSFTVGTIEQLSNRLARPGHQEVHIVL